MKMKMNQVANSLSLSIGLRNNFFSTQNNFPCYACLSSKSLIKAFWQWKIKKVSNPKWEWFITWTGWKSCLSELKMAYKATQHMLIVKSRTVFRIKMFYVWNYLHLLKLFKIYAFPNYSQIFY